MTKQKLTADHIDMLMQESDFDSSESDHDDSCDDANWDFVIGILCFVNEACTGYEANHTTHSTCCFIRRSWTKKTTPKSYQKTTCYLGIQQR